MKAEIKLIDGVAFDATTQSGHTVTIDGALEGGGQNKGPRPMEMLLVGLGGCTAYDVTTILRKARQDISDLKVTISAERASTDPKVFVSIHVHFIITGDNIKASAVKKAINLSAEKYCSASIMLGATAKITHDYEIVDAIN